MALINFHEPKIFLSYPLTLYTLSVYNKNMKRKPGDLVPTERAILEVAMELQHQGQTEFHGYQVAKLIDSRREKRYLTGYGTLYRALERLEELGFLASQWEEPDNDANKPPRRRFYRLTGKPAPALLKTSHDIGPVNQVLEKVLPWSQ